MLFQNLGDLVCAPNPILPSSTGSTTETHRDLEGWKQIQDLLWDEQHQEQPVPKPWLVRGEYERGPLQQS